MIRSLFERSAPSRMESRDHLPIVQPADQPRSFERFVFVCGLHRSGTTLIEQRLQAAFDVCPLQGPVPENEGQHLQDVYPAAREHGGPGRFAFSETMRTPVPDRETAAHQQARLLACWTPFVQGEGQTLLEKSPPNLLKIPYLRAVFPGATFVIMTRHPVAVAMATQKWAGTSVAELVSHWDAAHRIALADLGPDCLRLRYEDFCEDPEGEIARIGTYCGLAPRGDLSQMDARFSEIKNSNAKYLDAAERYDFGEGVWSDFGYDLSDFAKR